MKNKNNRNLDGLNEKKSDNGYFILFQSEMSIMLWFNKIVHFGGALKTYIFDKTNVRCVIYFQITKCQKIVLTRDSDVVRATVKHNGDS